MEDTKDNRFESGRRLNKIRSQIGVSQNYFASLLGLTLSSYKKIEAGMCELNVDMLKILKEELHISSDYLLYGTYTDIDDAIDIVLNCPEEDKMKLFLRLADYFIFEKKKTFSMDNSTNHLHNVADLMNSLECEKNGKD